MDGFEATGVIRRIENERGLSRESPDAPNPAVIIALTGLANGRDEDEAFKAGVDIFITKPVQFEKLSRLLKQYEEGTLWSNRELPA